MHRGEVEGKWKTDIGRDFKEFLIGFASRPQRGSGFCGLRVGEKSPEVVMIIIITCRSENRMMSASDGAIESSGEIRRSE